ncbi:MAG: hypothetical protein V4577_29965 [Bacteroidota bacterium]
MKNIIILLLLVVPCLASAQKVPDFGANKVRILQPDKIIEAEVIPVASAPKPNTGFFYYWYSSNKIHITQGGFSGRLLNGAYNEFYLTRNLKEQGIFDKGLKNGTWKSWNEGGNLIKITHWKQGVLLPDSTISFWKRINIFKKKKDSKPAVDTPRKAN